MPEDVDAEITRLMCELEGGNPSLKTLRAAVAACGEQRVKRTPKPKAPPRSPAEKATSRIRGRITLLLNKLRDAEAALTAHEANPKDFGLAMEAGTAWASINGYRMELQWHRENNPEIAAQMIPTQQETQ